MIERHPQVARAFGTELVPIDSVQPHPKNYRDHDVGAIAEGLLEYGQTKPIIVQRAKADGTDATDGVTFGYIVAGSGTWKAAKSLGWTEIGVRFMEWDDRTAEKYLVFDNRSHDLGRNEDDVLAELLTELAQEDALDATGFDPDDVDDLLVETGKLKLPTVSRGTRKLVTCPECGSRFDPKAK